MAGWQRRGAGHTYHEVMMISDLHCHQHLGWGGGRGAHKKYMRINIFGSMCVSVTYLGWSGGQDHV